MTDTVSQPTSVADAPRALIADDDPTMRLLTRAAPEDAGFVVEDVDDGSGVLARFADFRPDVVLLDVQMRDLHGFDTCAALRRLPEGEHVPILMMTGLDDVQSINRAYDAGATDFIVKPINWGLLGHRVRYLRRTAHALARLRDHERRLEEAQRLARVGSWEWNRAAGTVQWSAEMYRVLAIAPATEPSTGIWQARVHPEDAASREAAWQGALAETRRRSPSTTASSSRAARHATWRSRSSPGATRAGRWSACAAPPRTSPSASGSRPGCTTSPITTH